MEKENEPKERDLCSVACLQPVFFFCPDVFQMGSYFGYAVAATDINNDGWVTPAATVGTDDRKNAR